MELKREIDILLRTQHKHIVNLIGIGNDGAVDFIVMEYLEGGTLGKLLKSKETIRRNSLTIETFIPTSTCSLRENTAQSTRRRRHSYSYISSPLWPFANMLQRCIELATSLSYLQTECLPGVTIIHRDIKPDNIGLSRDGKLKLFDFGLSVAFQRCSYHDEAYQLTGNTGTFRYMAPEVALNQAYSGKADVYSFGMVCWQMASGLTPYGLVNKREFMEQVVHGGLRPALLPEWPKDFCSCIESCWHPNPDCRPTFDTIVNMLTISVHTQSPY
jgi:serine/threonine protein kinase